MDSFTSRLNEALRIRELSQSDLSKRSGISRSKINCYVHGRYEAKQTALYMLAKALNVSEAWLMGYDVPMERDLPDFNGVMPTVTDDIISYPVIGDIAAGYDHTAFENYDAEETVEIPASFLAGRPRGDFFVLKVIGDSMYPHYMEGDKVLIKKQSYVDRSGDIGAVLYDGDQATIKKLEFVQGEDWLRLVPINPNFPPHLIEGADLEQCRVLGVPFLLVRNI